MYLEVPTGLVELVVPYEVSVVDVFDEDVLLFTRLRPAVHANQVYFSQVCK
jgi:hypothetical protein